MLNHYLICKLTESQNASETQNDLLRKTFVWLGYYGSKSTFITIIYSPIKEKKMKAKRDLNI